jgi:hypothetical protein
MDVNEFGQIGKQKGDMQCRLSVLRTQSRFEHGKQLPTSAPQFSRSGYHDLDAQKIQALAVKRPRSKECFIVTE